MKTEKIKLLVTVNINYENAKGRKEAIKKAKECATSVRIYGMSGCDAKSAKLIK